MKPLPTYEELKAQLPLSLAERNFINHSRETVRSILKGIDPRLIVIIGPCSIHDPQSAQEFAHQLYKLSTEVSSHFFLIMRVYCEKPRTASGWKGFLYDPLLNDSHEVDLGIKWTRQLLIELAKMNIPAGTEFLDPLTAFYYDDLITWGSIGARTASSQTHRHLASALEMPIGFKNGIAGNISAAVHGAMTAELPHTFIRIGEQGQLINYQTKGNQDTHIVLRGGESGPNYDSYSISKALSLLEEAKREPRCIIDCAHHNSQKDYNRQSIVFESVIQQILDGNRKIKGLMLESNLFSGNQPICNDPSKLRYGVSITDPCIDWESTERLIRQAFHSFSTLKERR